MIVEPDGRSPIQAPNCFNTSQSKNSGRHPHWLIKRQFPAQILHLSTQLQSSSLHNLATQFKKRKGGKKTHFRSMQRPWCLVTTDTTNLCTFERKMWKEGGGETEGKRMNKKAENGWKLDTGCSMHSYVSLLRLRGGDLNVSIMHEVVLRYANMNYLTSQADLLLHLTFCISVNLLILSCFHFSLFLHLFAKSESPLKTASFHETVFAEQYRAQRVSESPPLSLSVPSVSAPL